MEVKVVAGTVILEVGGLDTVCGRCVELNCSLVLREVEE